MTTDPELPLEPDPEPTVISPEAVPSAVTNKAFPVTAEAPDPVAPLETTTEPPDPEPSAAAFFPADKYKLPAVPEFALPTTTDSDPVRVKDLPVVNKTAPEFPLLDNPDESNKRPDVPVEPAPEYTSTEPEPEEPAVPEPMVTTPDRSDAEPDCSQTAPEFPAEDVPDKT